MTTTAADPAAMTADEFEALAGRLRAAARAYYETGGQPDMDDAEYDDGVRRLRAAADACGYAADDLLGAVAAGQHPGGDAVHAVPMLSLDNAMDDAELAAFCARVEKANGGPAAYAVEPKLDGMALSAVYRGGRLVRVATRGSGLAGEDVTAAASAADGLPARLPEPADVEVRGECVMLHDQFAAANRVRAEHGDPPFANPRNAVSGTLMAKHRGYRLPLTFAVYAVVADGPDATHAERMDLAERLGFTTVRSLCATPSVVTGADAVRSLCADVEARRASFPTDIDGAVVKADDPALRAKMGEGSRAPRWATARKFPPETRATDLLDVVVSVGRTGNLTFTAVLAPVAVGGATVASATLHNPAQIAAKGVRLPDGGPPQRVWVRRAGDVIPEVVGPVDPSDCDGTRPYDPPTACPRCGSALDADGAVWRCARGRACGREEGIRYAVSRDCLDIEGMGEKIVAALVASGAVADVADLFDLDVAALLAVDRLGESNAAKILANVDRARGLPMSRVFCSLGVPLTGRSMSRRLARHFGTMDALRAADADRLCEVEGVGPERAAAIAAEVADLAPVLDRLAAAGIGQTEPAAAPAAGGAGGGSGPLAGQRVVVSGTVPGMTRDEAEAAAERLGATVSKSVSSKTTLLVAGPGAGSKVAKAEAVGAAVMPSDEFAALAAA